MISSAPAKLAMVLLAFALVLTPAICSCLGFDGQAMAATSVMEAEDCDDHALAAKTSSEDRQSNHHGANCDGAGCDDCSLANAFDDVKSDRYATVASKSVDSIAKIDGSVLAIAPIPKLIASVYPHRGLPPLVRATLVSLHTLLLI